MKILSWRWGEVVIEWPGYFRFVQWRMKSPRPPRAAASWPFLLVRSEEEFERPWLVNHERIHFAQQRESLILGLFLMGFVETLLARFWFGMTKMEAYYWKACEQEAYLNQNDPDYLKVRKPFAVLGYVLHKRRFRVTQVPGEIAFY